MSKNAFLDVNAYPLDWRKLTVEKLPSALEEGLKISRARLKELQSIPLEEASYRNIVMGLETLAEELGFAWNLADHLSSVADSPDIRRIKEAFIPKISAFYSSIYVSVPLWKRLLKIERNPGRLDEVQKRHLSLTLLGFRVNGAELGAARKKELVRIDKELSETSEKFGKRILDATNAFERVYPIGCENTTLRGLPASALEAAKALAAAKRKRGYRFTLQYPSFIAIMQNADNSELRQEFYQASQKVGVEAPFDTLPLIRKILTLRQRRAKLIGYPTAATVRLIERMLNTPRKVRVFLKKLLTSARPIALRDFKRLAAFKKELGDRSPLEPWDAVYYEEKLCQKELSFNGEALRPYFEFNRVLQTLFDLCGKLYGVRFREVKSHKSWHKDVKYVEILDGGRVIGGFYVDFFPRETKRSGGWHHHFLTGKLRKDGKLSPHIGTICGNLNSPTPKMPSLLSIDNVETLYHEFGHLMHSMMTEVGIPSLAGTSVPWDFVELPSQLMENYCYSAGYLPILARHHKTGKTLGAGIIKRFKAYRKFMAAFRCNAIAIPALFDLELHDSAKVPADIEAFVDKVRKPYRMPYPTQGRTHLRRFSHLWDGGYDTGYYSYLWSNVLEATAWEKFEKDGIMSRKAGMRFRKEILAKGNSLPPEKLFRNFRGCEPRVEAYLKRIK
jgi:oligopeptidase A